MWARPGNEAARACIHTANICTLSHAAACSRDTWEKRRGRAEFDAGCRRRHAVGKCTRWDGTRIRELHVGVSPREPLISTNLHFTRANRAPRRVTRAASRLESTRIRSKGPAIRPARVPRKSATVTRGRSIQLFERRDARCVVTRWFSAAHASRCLAIGSLHPARRAH